LRHSAVVSLLLYRLPRRCNLEGVNETTRQQRSQHLQGYVRVEADAVTVKQQQSAANFNTECPKSSEPILGLIISNIYTHKSFTFASN
jgi:hypothetical protein